MRFVTIKNVQLGMKLAKPLLDENGNVLLRAGNTLTPTVHKRLNSMELQGLYVEDEYSRDIEPIDLIEPQMRLDAMKALMKGDIKKAIKFAEEVADELYGKSSLRVNVIDIKNNKNYTYKHSVSCCVYATVVGSAMGLDREILRSLAVGALLHDLGKFELPESILHKTSKLTDEEMKLMKEHARIGYEKASAIQEVSSVARNAILFHHENYDGTGYFGLPNEKQHVTAKILRVIDTYDAMTSLRKFRPAYSPAEAIEYIMGGAGTLFDPQVVKVFVERFPLYPMGVTLRLSNGEKAVVYSNDINSARPVIRTMEEKLVDLSTDPQYRSVVIEGLD